MGQKAVSKRQKAENDKVLEIWSISFRLLSAYCLLPSALLLPGFVAGSPRLHASQSAEETAGTSSVASEKSGTPTSAFPPERSMIAAAATTVAPARDNVSIVSRVDSPVVITSSTTRTPSPARTLKPRRKAILPFSRSVQMNRACSCRATS